MPRRSSGGRAAARPSLRNPPQPARTAPPPASIQAGGGSALGGIGATIADGMAWGTGTAIAHRAVDAVLGPRVIQHETVAAPAPAAAAVPSMGSSGLDACNGQSKAFQDCINSNGSDIGKCQFYLDMLNECRRSSNGEMLRA